VAESSSANTKASDKGGQVVPKPTPSHRTRLQSVALPEPSLQTRGQTIPKQTPSHRTRLQRVALPEPSLQTRVPRWCLRAEWTYRSLGQMVWLDSD